MSHTNTNNFLKKISEKIREHEFSSFLLGVKWPKNWSQQKILKQKKELQFVLTKKIGEKFNAKPDHKKPEIEIILDLNNNSIEYWVRPIYVFGKYKKYSRKISQTKHYCRKCYGKKCSKCHYTRFFPLESIESILEKFFLKAFKAKKTRFHGAGREDIDVRMLGKGRQMVIEIINPKKRNANLKILEKKINANTKKISVKLEGYTTKTKIREIKNAKHKKVYKAIIECQNNVSKQKISGLKNKKLEVTQRTPKRVLHRRSDKKRKRKCKIIKTKSLTQKTIELTIKADAGLYIKEFISGENNNTNPSISQLIQNKCKCKKLDVIKVIEEQTKKK